MVNCKIIIIFFVDYLIYLMIKIWFLMFLINDILEVLMSWYIIENELGIKWNNYKEL